MHRHSPRPTASRWAAIGFLIVLFAAPSIANAQRPAAVRLFPKTAVAYVAVADTHDLRERLKQTGMGQMSADPQLRPLIDGLYGSLGTALKEVEQRAGASLGELLEIPDGEFAVCVVPQENAAPAVLALIDAGDHVPQMTKLLEHAESQLTEQGGEQREEKVGDDTVTVIRMGGGTELCFLLKDGTLAAATGLPAMTDLLHRWQTAEGESLSQNAQYAAILESCRRGQTEKPQVVLFVDPIGIMKSQASNNTGIRIAIVTLPALGLDGLLGVGGTLNVATDQFDMLMQGHLLLDNPRRGIPELIALEAVEPQPEPWIPAEAATYATFRWNVQKSLTKGAKLYDSFFEEGRFRSRILQPVNDAIGFDLEKEVLPLVDGRATMVTIYEKPTTLRSQSTMLGVKVKDADAAKKLLEKTIEHQRDKFTDQTYGGQKFYQLGNSGAENQPAICIGLLGDYLLASDRPSSFQRAIVASSDATQSLGGSLDYKLMASKISRLTADAHPVWQEFQRSEESFHWMYDLAQSEEVRQQLRDGGNRNPVLARLSEAVENNKLPPFAVIQQYLAPSGAYISDLDTGLHYVAFGFRRNGPGR